MVLESLVGPKAAESKAWFMFFIGFLYATVGLFLSVWVFKDQASIVMILLTVIACLPLMYRTLKYEEHKDIVIKKELTLLKEHGKALEFFIFMFMGFVVAFSLWFVVLPDNTVQGVYASQLSTIGAINGGVSGHAIEDTTAYASQQSSFFLQIFVNNMKVLLFCLFFSFFYGAGSIFILAWNASVISVAVGTFVRNNISSIASQVGLIKVGGYLHIFSLGLLRYAIHGIPEILAYFIGGLAGGIISIAVIRHDFGTKTFKKIIFDSFDLILLAVAVLFIAGLLEVYVTPLFF